MSANKVFSIPSKQKGVALIMLVLVLVIASAATFLSSFGGNNLKIERDKKTALALTEAKSALIGWSASHSTMPGILPCPEDVSLIGTPNEGVAKTSCTGPSLGRLPWKTLGFGDLRDGNGDKLWYVISNGFRSSPINLNSQAQLTVDGQQGAAVAIIFSSGPPLHNQIRSPINLANPAHYLDLVNANGGNAFLSKGLPAVFNDQLKIVTKNDLFKTIKFRILGEIRGDSSQGLKQYFLLNQSVYSYADINLDGKSDAGQLIGTPSYNGDQSSLFFSSQKKSMLVNNGWMNLTQYSMSYDRKRVTLLLGDQSMIVE